jgi:hypothetical protein
VLCVPRLHYGAVVPQVIDRGRLGFCFGHGAEVLVLRSDVPLEPSDQHGVRGHVRLRPGERRSVSLTYTQREAAVLPVFGEAAARTLTQMIGWWHTYGRRTPLVALLAHVIYGAILGAFYPLASH